MKPYFCQASEWLGVRKGPTLSMLVGQQYFKTGSEKQALLERG